MKISTILLLLIFVACEPDYERKYGGISEAQYHQVIDDLYDSYKDKVSALGGELVMLKDWENAARKVYTTREENKWIIVAFGG